MELHSSSKPVVKTKNCRCCNVCVKFCNHDAIHICDVETPDGIRKSAQIDYSKCVGCGQCIALCQYNAAVVEDMDTSEVLNAKIAEYTKAIVSDKPCFYINFIMNVSPECDCWVHNDAAIVPDIGIAASFDPVALDQACADLVIAAPTLKTGRLGECHCHEGEDKFHLLHPDTNWQYGLDYAQEIGIGSRDYELITI
jgi:uncharacterized Fe-S center protein